MNFGCFFFMAKNSISNPNKTNKINIELILWYSISKFGWQKKLQIFPSSLREITSSYHTSYCIIKRYLGTWEIFYIVKYNAVSIKARVCYFQLTHAHTNSHTHTSAKGWMHYMHIWCNLCTDYVWNMCSKKINAIYPKRMAQVTHIVPEHRDKFPSNLMSKCLVFIEWKSHIPTYWKLDKNLLKEDRCYNFCESFKQNDNATECFFLSAMALHW